MEGYTKYSIAVQKNTVVLYIQIGKDVQDLWTDTERKREREKERKREGGRKEGRGEVLQRQKNFQVMLFLMISNIHNLELCEDQNTGKAYNQSYRKQANKRPFFLWLKFLKAFLKYKKSVLFILITTIFYCYSFFWQDKSHEFSNPAVLSPAK